LEGLALLYGDLGMNFLSIDGQEAMKQGDEALNSS
jgi:hypothetical protein